jgi:3-oxoacyl-[acyl-carrier-protein] synthase III
MDMVPQASPVGICAAAYHLPGDPVDLVPWAQQQQVPPRLIESLLANGCRCFHAAPACTDAAFAASAIDRLDAPPGWQRGVRYLVHAHTQAFSMAAPPASILAELCARYGFEPALAFSVGHLACASVLSAVDCAARLLADDADAEYALVVTSDRVFGEARYRIQGQTSVQSDGASALLLGRSGLRCRLGQASFKNFTQLHPGPSTPALAITMARFLWRHMAALLREHEVAAGLPLRAYDEILPANADLSDWARVVAELDLPDGQVYVDNIGHKGHACCADLAVNLVDRGFERLAAGGLLLAFGQSNVGAFAAQTLWPAAPPRPAGTGR